MAFDHNTATESGSRALTPRTHADSGRATLVSKCTTCARACTPRSVRPAAVTLTGTPAMTASAGSRASCTPPPPGCVCQPRKRLPSYSTPRAMRPSSAQLGEQLLRLALLPRVAVLHHFAEQLARAVLVAHFLVGLGEIQLGGDLLPFRVAAGAGRGFARRAEIEADVGKVHRRRRGGAPLRRRALVAAHVEIEVEIEPAARLGGSRG